MKIKINYWVSNICLFFLFNIAFGQKIITVSLNRQVYPVYNYLKSYQKGFANDSHPNSSGKFILDRDYYNVIAGDYKDNYSKFTIAINTIQIPSGVGIAPFFQTEPGTYDVYLGPFGSDSIYILHGKSSKCLKPDSIFFIKAGEYEYAATFNPTKRQVHIGLVNNMKLSPDLILYNDRLATDTSGF